MHVSLSQIMDAVADPDWQQYRRRMKGKPTDEKLRLCLDWLVDDDSDQRHIQVQNYLNALARGGQIAPTNKSEPVPTQVRNAKIRR